MKGRLINVAALVSALVFAWACWAWVRSYQPRHLALEASEGRLFVTAIVRWRWSSGRARRLRRARTSCSGA